MEESTTQTPEVPAETMEAPAETVEVTPQTVEVPADETPVETPAEAVPEQPDPAVVAFEARIAELQAALDAERASAETERTARTAAETRVADIERERATAADNAARAKAIADAGLPEDFTDRLRGSNADEYAADAKAIAKAVRPAAPSTGATNPGGRRTEKVTSSRNDNPFRL